MSGSIYQAFRTKHDSKALDTPIEKGLALTHDQCPKIDDEKEQMSNGPHHNVIGSFMYAMLYLLWASIFQLF